MSINTLSVYTIGHSTRTIDDFIKLIKSYGIEEVIDVRTIPGSKHNPQYNEENLKISLAEQNIEYLHIKELGGLRKPNKDSINMGWKNKSFRGYADYMQTPEFSKALNQLIDLSKSKTVAIMCAEAVPWKCHRSLIGDSLVASKIAVEDIIAIGKSSPHELTKFAKVSGGNVTYPL